LYGIRDKWPFSGCTWQILRSRQSTHLSELYELTHQNSVNSPLEYCNRSVTSFHCPKPGSTYSTAKIRSAAIFNEPSAQIFFCRQTRFMNTIIQLERVR
jgi:hypothetical protein